MAARSLCAALLVIGMCAEAATDPLAAGQAPSEGRPWTVQLVGSVGLKMGWIPAGTFTMGSSGSEALRRADEGPVTQVTLRRGYWLGTTLVTIGQWKALMGSGVRAQLEQLLRDDSLRDFGGTKETLRAYMHFSADADPDEYLAGDSDELPMYYLSWQDAVSFCERLNARERAAGRLPSDYEYALPTEAQWEYAARAGSATASYAGDLTERDQRIAILDEIAWYDANSAVGHTGRGWLIHGQRAGPHPVAQKRPNDWGLYDMTGDLWEWCRDWYGAYAGGQAFDPIGPASGSARVNRGGSFGSSAGDMRSAARAGNPPAEASAFRGFRLALTPRTSLTGL